MNKKIENDGLFLQAILLIYIVISFIVSLFINCFEVITYFLMFLILLVLCYNNNIIYKRKYMSILYLIVAAIILVVTVVKFINAI